MFFVAIVRSLTFYNKIFFFTRNIYLLLAEVYFGFIPMPKADGSFAHTLTIKEPYKHQPVSNKMQSC